MKSHLVAVVTASVLLASWPAAAQSTLDGWTCARARLAEPRGNFRVVLGSPVGPQNCTVRRPARLVCVPTSGTTVTPEIPGSAAAPAGSILCYALNCRRPIGSQEQLNDAFGQHTVGLRLPRWLCTPAVSPSAGPTTTTAPGSSTSTTTVAGSSTTSTTIEGNTNCRFENGECRGTCTGTARCRAAAGTASCECRDVACGDADAPACNGACPSSDDACVFTVTSCRCIHIP